MNNRARHRRPRSFGRAAAFTLVELLIVAAIIAILAAIGIVNMRRAVERAENSADAANLHAVATALQMYTVDYGKLPLGDQIAGPFASHTADFTGAGDGPAAGGSWNGVPWLLVDRGYLNNWTALFCPKYVKLYSGNGTAQGANWPRYHNFRYAYNSGNAASGAYSGGDGNINTGERWIVRDLFLPADRGFYRDRYPAFPADFAYPWGEGDYENKLEHVLYADLAVKTVVGGTNTPAGSGN